MNHIATVQDRYWPIPDFIMYSFNELGPVRLILFRLILISSTPILSNLVSSNNVITLLLVEFFLYICPVIACMDHVVI